MYRQGLLTVVRIEVHHKNAQIGVVSVSGVLRSAGMPRGCPIILVT